jgi:hypothetical protein
MMSAFIAEGVFFGIVGVLVGAVIFVFALIWNGAGE